MTDALDMKTRTKSVNDKITYAAEVSILVYYFERSSDFDCRCNPCFASCWQRYVDAHVLLADPSDVRVFCIWILKSSGHRMELIIIALIAVEVVIVRCFDHLTNIG